MPRNYWVTSDTHFFHANSLKWGRPFDSVEEMNETMVENWNKVVKPGDYVYHLGDVFMGQSSHEERHKVMNRLKGKKTLIVGNHDDIPYLVSGNWFRKVMMWKVFTEFKCLLTHVPVHESSLGERLVYHGGINVHGHIHTHPSPPGPYRCVCVEQINYTPVNLEEIRDSI